MSKATINITTTSAGHGLKEKLHAEAGKRSIRKGPFIEAIIEYAVLNRDEFKEPLKKPFKKDGKHIAVKVKVETKEAIRDWAEEIQSTQAMLTNHILEKAYTDIGITKII